MNHETQNDNGVEGSRLRCPVLPASCRASTIFVSGPRAMRVGLKPSSALRALRRTRRRRPRHRGSSFSFSPPAIPARHTSHHSINPPAGVHIQAHMVRHSPHPIHLRASCTVPRFCGLISSHLVHPICDSPASGGCRAAPIAHSPRVNHTGHAQHIQPLAIRPLKRLNPFSLERDHAHSSCLYIRVEERDT